MAFSGQTKQHLLCISDSLSQSSCASVHLLTCKLLGDVGQVLAQKLLEGACLCDGDEAFERFQVHRSWVMLDHLQTGAASMQQAQHHPEYAHAAHIHAHRESSSATQSVKTALALTARIFGSPPKQSLPGAPYL